MKVMIATDGSKYGKWATEWVARMPFAEKPDVSVLHVTDVEALRAPFMFQPVVVGNEPFLQQEIKRIEGRGKAAMAEAKTQMASLKLKGKVIAERGAAGPTILKRAPQRDGLVAIGSRGLDALDRFMLGSVSTQVTLHAPCSVLVVKEEPRPLSRILFAADGSKASDKALRFLLTKLQPEEREGLEPIDVVVMHAMPFLKYPELKEAGVRLVEQYANKLMKAGYVVDEVVQLGKPAEEILKTATKKNVDLIVTGAKGMGAVARFLLGSISTKVVQHSTCSVLVVR
ncbi:MAG: universal stress protein [Nitrospira sp.]|jgi:nucleotide-binding universal stress UspA family protein|nr:universal stress protein [Nitrospira sp.]MBP6605015.1 universal stress protein [Nitrospira sp.]MCI1279670.1 universal stress protein [Nitrospira sp.]HQY58442.1 universal stress protein [Nitrospira sp.]HRA98055.1 universal stress protein [Nitrospira sp.]